MHVQGFAVREFRNILEAELRPCEGVNVIFGENGQGKTNLLEGLWLFTGCRSFRGADNAELVMDGRMAAGLEVRFCSNEREQCASMEIARRRTLNLNGFAQETTRRMLGVFPAVAFTPATLSLAQGGPGERRRFVDVALSILMPSYALRLSKYLKALAQRNALLRQIAQGGEDMLDTWDAALAREAAGLTAARLKWLERIIPAAREFYDGISAGRETLDVAFCASGVDCYDEADYLAALERARKSDLRRQLTSVGPHRDDLRLSLNGKSLRDFGSQGQQRSAALAMKLAEAAVLRDLTDECPIALLDDVLSELDARRQTDLLRFLEGWQVFLTCCEPSHALHGKAGKVFLVANGKVEGN